MSFSIAVITLLAVPGPTNTLLAAAGAARGWVRSTPLLAAELGGYVASISLQLLLLAPLLVARPDLAALLKMTAGTWVAWCAWRMWRQSRPSAPSASPMINFRQVLITTLVNPKAVIFALVVFPPLPYDQQIPFLSLFAVITVFVGGSWIALGTVLAQAIPPRQVRILAAMALALFAVTLGAQAATTLVASPTITDSTR